MDKEEKKKIVKEIKQVVKGVAFLVVIGAIVGHSLMNEEQRRAFMGDTHGFFAELGCSIWVGFLWVMGAFLTWGMFNWLVLGKDITKQGREVS